MNSLPNIFVINLERSKNRRQFMINQFNGLDLPFEFVKASDGKKITRSEKNMFSSFKSFKNMGRELNPNEKGCYLSHLYIWQRMVDNNIKEAIIFEDDITLSKDFKTIVKSREAWLPNNWRIVNFAWDTFGNYRFDSQHPIKTLDDYAVIKFAYSQGVMRSGSYMLNLETAKILVASSKPITFVLDTLLGEQRIHKMPIHGIMPRIAFWNDNIASEINDTQGLDTWIKKNRTSLKGIIYRILLRLKIPVFKS